MGASVGHIIAGEARVLSYFIQIVCETDILWYKLKKGKLIVEAGM